MRLRIDRSVLLRGMRRCRFAAHVFDEFGAAERQLAGQAILDIITPTKPAGSASGFQNAALRFECGAMMSQPNSSIPAPQNP
jgi:hypothetical protein